MLHVGQKEKTNSVLMVDILLKNKVAVIYFKCFYMTYQIVPDIITSVSLDSYL